tara:strand:- start:71 stop:472 length:402 start_codon:yes stop_codon:yes gene_type:complete
MKKFILTFAIGIGTLLGFSQEKGTTQISALNISSESAIINVSSPSITHYFFDNVGLTVGIANFEDINIGTRYYIKDNNFAYAGYGTGSESLDIGLGKTYGWGENVQIEPRLNFTDVISDDRNLGLSVHLNFVF